MNAKERIKNWQDESKADLESAIAYINRKRFIHGLFLCHLVIEKSLKAIIVNQNGGITPKSHDINSLAKKAEVDFTNSESKFIDTLINYKIQGRYPDDSASIPSKSISEDYLKQTRAIMQKLYNLT